MPPPASSMEFGTKTAQGSKRMGHNKLVKKNMKKTKVQIRLQLDLKILKFSKNPKEPKPLASDLQKTTNQIYQIKLFLLSLLKVKVGASSKTFLRTKRKSNSTMSIQNICLLTEKNT